MDEKLVLTIEPHEIESTAFDQINRALNIPFLEKLVILPDVHAGYDIPIGSVALLNGYIWPGAVGYDIYCGMCHVNTGKTLNELKLTKKNDREELYNEILREIPVGFNMRKTPFNFKEFTNASGSKILFDKVESRAGYQIGTLGGGNHFIEVGVNGKNEVGITIHSGSRNPGHSIAEYWMNKVKDDGETYNGLSMYSLNAEPGWQYFKDMLWAKDYAFENRRTMIKIVLNCMGLNLKDFDMVNESHNHAEVMKNGQNVIHRKGAIRALEGQFGIIPSNQRDGVYITKGLGNEFYLSSASHGAGRTMSRKKAKKSIEIDKFKSQMDGIISRTDKDVLDEAPDAYKKIDEVLKAQDGIIVDIIDHFSPLIVVKG